MSELRIQLAEWDEPRIVSRADYIKAKTKQLKEFGYTTLDSKHVSEQLDKVLAGEEKLSVIGMFMKDEVQGSA